MYKIYGGDCQILDGHLYMENCTLEFDFLATPGDSFVDKVTSILEEAFPYLDFRKGEHLLKGCMFKNTVFSLENE